ncbi:MAG: cupredoxin domain-containing protein [Pseudomonadota bacterium]|nr:plastocyanin [Pseudomonadales bacterium]MDY6920862.1 cupredoxin domain-containing protein [Pseudomonadota bacterium]
MIWINLAGLALIGFIVWWFWIYQPPGQAVTEDNILILVDDGVYQPAHLTLPAGKPVRLSFLRKDASPCAESVIFPTLDISQRLPTGQTKTIALPALEPGKYPFHCQMQMYRGSLTVKA